MASGTPKNDSPGYNRPTLDARSLLGGVLDHRPTLDARTLPSQGLSSVSALSELSRKLSMQSESSALGLPSASPLELSSTVHSPGASVSSQSSSMAARPYDRPASVIGLRDRLIREARNERQRCLEVAEAAERRRSEFRGTCAVATQTDPVIISLPGSLLGGLSRALINGADGSVTPGASGLPSGCVTPVSSVNTACRGGASPFRQPYGAIAPGGSPSASSMAATPSSRPTGWSQQDDEEQAEALRTIQMLGQRSSQASDSGLKTMEDQLRRLRRNVAEVQEELASERSQKEAAQQQVLCLEYELDGKESSLQASERNLEKRDQDLQQAQNELRSAKDLGKRGLAGQHISSLVPGSGLAEEQRFPLWEARVTVMRDQLLERERQMELKDQHISRLLSVLRQHRNFVGDAEASSSPAGGDLSILG